MNSDFDELLRLFNANGVRFELVGRSPRTAADALVSPSHHSNTIRKEPDRIVG